MFTVIGAVFAVGSLRYELGTLLSMGPGYVPLAVSCVLLALGVAVIVKAYVAPDTVSSPATSATTSPATPPATPPGTTDRAHRPETEAAQPASASLRSLDWRAVGLITAAPVFFGMTVPGLGLLPAAFGAGLLTAFARRETSLLRGVLVAAGLTLASYVIFVVLLQVRIGLLGDWLGG